VPKPFRKSDFKPAVLDPNTGKTYTGFDHLGIPIPFSCGIGTPKSRASACGFGTGALQAAENDGVHNLGQGNTGFLRNDGTFYTRASRLFHMLRHNRHCQIVWLNLWFRHRRQTWAEWGFRTSADLR